MPLRLSGLTAARAVGGRAPLAIVALEDTSATFDRRVRNVAGAGSLRRAGWEVRIVSPRYPGDPRRTVLPDGTAVRSYRQPRDVGGPFAHVVEYVWSVAALAAIALPALVGRRTRVVHLCNPPDLLFVIGLLARALGARVVYDQHDRCPELLSLRYPGAPRAVRAAVAWAERMAVRVAHVTLVTNESARATVTLRAGGRPERVFVVRNGPRLDEIDAIATISRDGAGTLVGYLGAINPQDGLDVLVDCAAAIVLGAGRTDVRFVVVGDGSSLADVSERSARLGLGEHVRFTGRLRPEEALAAMGACDVCVQPDPPNEFTHGCTMAKASEYMALGRPVATFDLRESRVAYGAAALYAAEATAASLAHAILRLVDDPALRRSLGAAARQRAVASLGWASSEPALLAAYALARPADGGSPSAQPGDRAAVDVGRRRQSSEPEQGGQHVHQVDVAQVPARHAWPRER